MYSTQHILSLIKSNLMLYGSSGVPRNPLYSNILENSPLHEGINHFPSVTVKASGFQMNKHSAI